MMLTFLFLWEGRLTSTNVKERRAIYKEQQIRKEENLKWKNVRQYFTFWLNADEN